MKGITNDIDNILIYKSLFFKSVVLVYFDVNMTMVIKVIFTINRIGRVEKKRFLLFLVSSDINLERAIGIENVPIFIKREKVGSINMYIARPFVPINLDIVILIIRPKIFVIKPPIKRIIVDLINFSFIVKFMLN